MSDAYACVAKSKLKLKSDSELKKEEETQEQGQGEGRAAKIICGATTQWNCSWNSIDQWLRKETNEGGVGQQEAAGENAKQAYYGQGANDAQAARGEIQWTFGHTYRALWYSQGLLDEMKIKCSSLQLNIKINK